MNYEPEVDEDEYNHCIVFILIPIVSYTNINLYYEFVLCPPKLIGTSYACMQAMFHTQVGPNYQM